MRKALLEAHLQAVVIANPALFQVGEIRQARIRKEERTPCLHVSGAGKRLVQVPLILQMQRQVTDIIQFKQQRGRQLALDAETPLLRVGRVVFRETAIERALGLSIGISPLEGGRPSSSVRLICWGTGVLVKLFPPTNGGFSVIC